MAFGFALIFWVALVFIVYTYFGYPILITLLALIRPAPKWSGTFTPQVTLVIAAYNEEKVIQKKLENTLELDYPCEKLQIIVAADGSADGTVDIVKRFEPSGVLLSFVPERGGKMAALVRAVHVAKGDIVVFSDANNMYEASAVRKLVAPFADDKVGGAVGAKRILEDGRDLSSAEGLYWKYESWIKKSETRLGSCTSGVGEIIAIRRDLFEVPTTTVVTDDRYMVFRLLRRGHRVVYVPEARSYEYASKSAADEITRRSHMAAGAIQTISMSSSLLPLDRPVVLWQIVSHKYFRVFVPYAMILALFSNIALLALQGLSGGGLPFLLASPMVEIFLLLQILFYSTAVLGSYVRPGGMIGKIFYLPVFLVNSNFAMLLGMQSFLLKKQSHLWKKVER